MQVNFTYYLALIANGHDNMKDIQHTNFSNKLQKYYTVRK